LGEYYFCATLGLSQIVQLMLSLPSQLYDLVLDVSISLSVCLSQALRLDMHMPQLIVLERPRFLFVLFFLVAFEDIKPIIDDLRFASKLGF